MINAQKYIEQCYMLERGAPRLKVYKEAINAANMEKDADNELEFMYSYISEAIFHDDNYKAVLMFPEYMALFDAHPEFQACHQLDFMRAFKYIIENVYDYYQISLEQVDKYFDEYKERCIKYGYSLRTYYMKYITFYSKCDRKKAEESFKLYKECKHDVLGDCDACEMNTDVEFELEFGTHEKALEIAAPILRGDKSCGEIPEMTYAKLISFYMYNGVYSEAEHYVRLLVPMIKGNIAYLLQRGILLSYYSQTQPYDGIKMFEENYPVALDTNNPRAHFHFYLGAYHVFSSIEMRTDVEELHLKMPKKFKLYDRENMYKIKELAEYFENECRKLAELFDARNKSDYYMNLYKTELKVQQNVSFQLPSHATVEPTESVMGIVPLKSDIVIDKDIISDLIDKSPDMELLRCVYDDEHNTCFISLIYIEKEYNIVVTSIKDKVPEYRQCHYISEENIEILKSSENMILTYVSFKDRAADSYHLQLKLINTLFLQSAAVIDFSRHLILSPVWVKLAAESSVPPLPEYLVNIDLIGDGDSVIIITSGLSCLGLRELVVTEFSRDNYLKGLELVNYIAKTIVQSGNMHDLGEKACMIYRKNKYPFIATWVEPDAEFTEKIEGYDDAPKKYAHIMYYSNNTDYLRRKMKTTDNIMGKYADELYIHSSGREEYITAALAKERAGWIAKGFEQSGNALVMAEFELSDELQDEYDYEYEVMYVKVQAVNEDSITGVLLDTSDIVEELKENTEVTVKFENIMDFKVKYGEYMVTPDTVYLLAEQ